jgi:hypothetical protein
VKRYETTLTLDFGAVRWPRARAAPGQFQLVGMPSGYVDVAVERGIGRAWKPEPIDATWRSLAELDLGDVAAVERFVQLRGDPFGELRPGHPITSSQWIDLVEALRIVAGLWQPPDAAGASAVVSDARRVQAGRKAYSEQAIVRSLMKTLSFAASAGTDEFGMHAPTLAAFLVVRAWYSLAPRARAMSRCVRCAMWFDRLRPQKGSRFCSPTCRAMYHQFGAILARSAA